MKFTTKDKIALLIAILLGPAFAYLSVLAGYGGIVIAACYWILIVPIVVVAVAGQSKILVWQVSIVSYALYIVLNVDCLGGLGKMGGRSVLSMFLAPGVLYMFWAIGMVLSSPVPILLYWQRSKNRDGRRLVWLFLGVVFVGVVSSLWHDPFLFVGLALLWITACTIRFAWELRRSLDRDAAKIAIAVSATLLVLLISISAGIGLYFKQSAFFSAMDHHYPRIARFLVTMGADPNARNAFGQSALDTAAWSGDLTGATTLISMGANVNRQQAGALYGMLPSGTALHVATSAGRLEICKALLEAGAEVDAKNRNDATPLLVGLSRGTIACAPTLLVHGADVNATDKQGRTALMFIMMYGENDPMARAIFHELLVRGADVNAKDSTGKTVEDWATDYKRDCFKQELRLIRESASRNP